MSLAVDTSTNQGSVALQAGTMPLAEWSWTARGNHSQHLWRSVHLLLSVEALEVRDIEALTVAVGPGSFSGIRVGVSFAKGLSMGLGVPLVGIGTLDVIAFQALHASTDTAAFIPAGREQVYGARFLGDSSDFRQVGPHVIVSPNEALHMVTEGTLLSGPGAELVHGALAEAGRRGRREPPTMQLRRAAYLAELGRRYFSAGGQDQTATLEPLYLRRSSAEERRDATRE